MRVRIILNGKKAGLDEVRSAITLLRKEFPTIEVRVTWESGDGLRLVNEAIQDGIQRIVAAGGDGTVNEIINALAKQSTTKRPELAIIPLGTANDFATACNIPLVTLKALRLAISGAAKAIDIVRANDRYFVNIASAGFGSQITADTPPQLKNFLGGGAYALTAVVKSLNFSPVRGRLLAQDIDFEGTAVVAAICNGRQAGGGQVLAPGAYIDDGLLDVMVILSFPLTDVSQVIQEILTPSIFGQYVKRFQTKWVESQPNQIRSVNLDGEPYKANHIRFDVLPKEIQLVLPKDCPCIFGNKFSKA